jgi:hypothetical protein
MRGRNHLPKRQMRDRHVLKRDVELCRTVQEICPYPGRHLQQTQTLTLIVYDRHSPPHAE